MTEKIKKIVLAYSGGLDTSVMLHWLRERYGCEVVCYCADVGQGEELAGLEEKAVRTGASKLYVEDLRREFVEGYVWPAVKANAVYEGVYLLGTSLARPVIAKRQIEIARREGADAVAHGATGKGNDQVRFELTYYALEPEIKVVAPWREWEFKGRSDLISYCERHKIPVTATHAKPYSTDRNLMHVSYEGGILEDPWAEPPADIFQMTAAPEAARAGAEYVRIGFELGVPLSVKFAESVYYGFWFAPESELMRKVIDETQTNVTGDVRLKLYRGNVTVVGRRSPHTLYRERLATFEADSVYDQRDAEGFIKLNALRLRTRKAVTGD